MSKFTTAYSSLLVRLTEVEILRKIAAQKERRQAVSLRTEINALSRGAVVLLSSHLEAYIKELGELALDSLFSKKIQRNGIAPAFFYHISKDLIDELKDTSEPEKIGEKIFNFLSSDHEFWERSGVFANEIPSERFNKGFSNPAFKKIKAYFNRFGYGEFQRDLSAQLKGDYLPIINMIDHLVDIRNKIAHGDQNATKTPKEVKVMIDLVKKFCQQTDAIFSIWWRSKYCSIR